MKTTMFTRILLATLFPVLLVLVIVIGTTRNIMYTNSTVYAKESVMSASKQISERASNLLESAVDMLNTTSIRLAHINYGTPSAEQNADDMLSVLISLDPVLCCVWYAFEPGFFSDDSHYYKTMVRMDGGVETFSGLNVEMLNDFGAAPWYNIPLITGGVYADIMGEDGFAAEESPVFKMTYPIVTDNGIVGCVGMDIRYEDLFDVNEFTNGEQKIRLLSSDGTILYSLEHAEIGENLLDFYVQSSDGMKQALWEKSIWQDEVQSSLSGGKSLVCLNPLYIQQIGQTISLCWDTPTETLYSTFNTSMEVILITGVFGMILLGFCVMFTTRSIVKHIKQITGSFQRVANGGAEITLEGEHISVYRTNVIEMEILQSALVSMIMQLRKAHDLKLQAIEAEIENEKLMAASEAKTQFLASMSHEIRTPMNAILGISQIMLLEGGLTEAQEKYIQDIKISSDALLSIINDILDISKLEMGKMNLHPDHYNFKALIDNIASLSTHLAGDANLQFLMETDDELPMYLCGDGPRLRQILLNLIGNAVKFTKQGFVLMRIFIQGEMLCFDVVDSGIGIRESELDTIFESFKRIDTRRNREVKGTGLGLSISKNLVELMGGSISVTSVHGTGSTFSVAIPMILGDEKEIREAKIGEGVKYSESLKVLIVDDNEINLSVSSGLFKASHGILCDTAASGWEAIAKVQKEDYDIIFMDHMMPEFDGVDTTRFIRLLGGSYTTIPIIALTANAVTGTRETLLEAGMDDFLTKPIQSERLQEILYTWVPEDKRLPSIREEARPTATSSLAETPKAMSLSDLRLKGMLEAEGVDISAGLENIGFDEDMYLQSLRLLKDKILQIVLLLSDLLEQKNMRDFRIHIHGLKGSLASVGATTLSEQAKKLELASANDNINYCRTYLSNLTEKLQHFCEKLDAVLPSQKTSMGSAAFDEEEFHNRLQRICTALESYDYEAVTHELQDILTMDYDPETSENVLQLKLLIDNFDYSGAAAFISEKIINETSLQ